MLWYFKIWQQSFDFKGRAKRKEFWGFFGINCLISSLFLLLEINIHFSSYPDLFFSLISLLPTIAIAIRRLHDTGRSGWWLCLLFLPVIGQIALIYLLALPSLERGGPDMSSPARAILTPILFLGLTCLFHPAFPSSVHASEEMNIPQNLNLPENAKGVYYLSHPKLGSLMQLKGITGDGFYLTRNDAGQLCQIEKMPLLAGQLGGNEIGITVLPPIQLIIYDEGLSKQLISGHQISSDDIQSIDQIKIVTGLDPAYGFILNPERRWVSWLWAANTRPNCLPI